MKQYRYLIIALALALAFPAALGAQLQVSKGSISGTVFDTSGGVVPDAKVTLTSDYGARETKAGPDGSFLFLSLEPGRYSIIVEYANFKTTTTKNVVVRLNERTNVAVNLEPGAITQTITVTEAAVGVDPSTTSSGGTISADLFAHTPIGRNISEAPYLVAGVSESLGAGRANPSISGGSGLENMYIVNGVNITDSGHGAFGTYSSVFGSIGSGVQFDWVKEVQVKTSGFEAQYGQALGGVINMVTKSGSNAYHGSAYFFASPDPLEGERKQSDDVRFNQGTKLVGTSSYDVGGELGGYLQRDRFFWYGGVNAVFVRDVESAPANFRAISLGDVLSKNRTLGYTAKISYNLTANQNHQIEGSVFGDPSTAPFGPHRTPTITNGGSLQSDFPERRFSALDYGSRNWGVRYNGTMAPSWLVNASFNWSHQDVTESGFQNVYRIQDRTEATPGGVNKVGDGLPTPLFSRGINEIGGLGFTENTVAENKQVNVNSTNTFRFFGHHQVDYGYQFENVDFDWFHRRTGPDWTLPCQNADGDVLLAILSTDCGKTVFGADGRLRTGGPSGFRYHQTRGAFTGQVGTTNTKYHAVYLQDAWQLSKYITLKLGARWEQQRIAGEDLHYAFTGNWAPRLGVIVDPFGTRKTKVFFNFGRFFEKIPQDLAVRSLSEERSYISMFFAVTNPNSLDPRFNNNSGQPGSTTPGCQPGDSLISCTSNPANYVLDAAHNINNIGAIGGPSFSGGVTDFAVGTKMQYQDEYVVGFEREFRGGVLISARYIDRRLRRIVEDTSGFTAGASIWGVASDGVTPLLQTFLLANPSASTDIFHNTLCDPNPPGPGYTGSVPNPFNEDTNPDSPTFALGCLDASGTPQYVADTGFVGPDGLPDGFPNPIRKYQAFEFSIEKRFTKNWQLVANWRLSKLFGNYEGLFRNDNGQDDSNITSLFDFVGSTSLGDQFTPGVLPTDRRDIVNLYASYLFNNGLNLGVGWRFQTGYPLDKLGAHPVYLNQGEVPLGGRGSQGRSLATTNIDAHVDYTWKMTERYHVRFAADVLNIVNARRVARVDRYADTGFLSGVSPPIQPNPDFLKPTAEFNAYQRPIFARLSVRLVF